MAISAARFAAPKAAPAASAEERKFPGVSEFPVSDSIPRAVSPAPDFSARESPEPESSPATLCFYQPREPVPVDSVEQSPARMRARDYARSRSTEMPSNPQRHT